MGDKMLLVSCMRSLGTVIDFFDYQEEEKNPDDKIDAHEPKESEE
jgi:hypothetical protein